MYNSQLPRKRPVLYCLSIFVVYILPSQPISSCQCVIDQLSNFLTKRQTNLRSLPRTSLVSTTRSVHRHYSGFMYVLFFFCKIYLLSSNYLHILFISQISFQKYSLRNEINIYILSFCFEKEKVVAYYALFPTLLIFYLTIHVGDHSILVH